MSPPFASRVIPRIGTAPKVARRSSTKVYPVVRFVHTHGTDPRNSATDRHAAQIAAACHWTSDARTGRQEIPGAGRDTRFRRRLPRN